MRVCPDWSGGELRRCRVAGFVLPFSEMKSARLLLVLLLSSIAFGQASYDVILSGGKIVDGTGNAWFYGDVAISGNRIAKITGAGLLDHANAKERIDVHGLVVAHVQRWPRLAPRASRKHEHELRRAQPVLRVPRAAAGVHCR